MEIGEVVVLVKVVVDEEVAELKLYEELEAVKLYKEVEVEEEV